MATTLWLDDVDESGLTVSGYDVRKLVFAEQAGTGTEAKATTTAGGNHIEFRASAGAPNPMIWAVRIEGVTISGTVSFDLPGREAAMGDNAKLAARVLRLWDDGTIVANVVAEANANHADNVELGTADAHMTWTATPTSTTFDAGDWLGIILHADAVGTMGAGTATVIYGGSAANVDDAKFTVTETVTAFVPPTFDAADFAGTFQPASLDEQLTDDPRLMAQRRPWHRRHGLVLPLPGLFLPARA